jgi:WD40 repeat protein
LFTLLGHTAGVLGIAVFGAELYSGGGDSVVIKWNIENGTMLHKSPMVHRSTIWCFAYKEGALYSGSIDASVVQWNANTLAPLTVYRGRSIKQRFVLTWRNVIISCGEGAIIEVWNNGQDSFSPIAVLVGHLVATNCLSIHEDLLYSGSTDTTIRQWNIVDYVCLKIYTGHVKSVGSIDFDNSFMYSGGQDMVNFQWNISLEYPIGEYRGHTKAVTSVQVGTQYLFSGSYDFYVIMWDTATGARIRSFLTLNEVNDILLVGDGIVAANYGVQLFSIFTGAVLAVQEGNSKSKI